MVDQLWYTWSLVGLEAVSGFQIRAASAGLANLRMESVRALAPFLLYQLPEDADPYHMEVASAPISLLLSNSAAPGDPPRYILAQRRYRGKDRHGRPGNYFVHLLAGLPAGFGAREAIALWRSPIWKSDDSELGESDFALNQLSTNQLIPSSASITLSADSANDLAFLIHACLTTDDNQRIYIAAPPDIVAAYMLALTHCLPRGLTQRLTFNTYERNLRDARERLVGTCLMADSPDAGAATRLLPEWCYSAGAALNCYTGQRSQLPEHTAAAFAKYAAQRIVLAGDDAQELARLLATAEALRLSQITPFLAFFLASSNAHLDREYLEAILASADLAGALLSKTGVRQQIMNQINRDGQWWEKRGKSFFTALRDSAEYPEHTQLRSGLALLSQDIIPIIQTGIVSGDPQATTTWRGVLQAILPSKQTVAEFLLAVLMPLASPTSRNPRLWDYMLRLLANETPDIAISRIHDWLTISWDEVDALFAIPLPESWKTTAIEGLLSASHDHYPESALSAVSRHQPVFQTALSGLIASGDESPAAISFLAWLGGKKYPEFMNLSAALLLAAQGNQSLEDALLGVSLRTLPSPDNVTLLLQNSRPALDYLKLPKFRHEVIALSLNDEWWRAHGRATLRSLQGQAIPESKQSVASRLLDLAVSTVPYLRDALIKHNDQQTLRLLELLRIVAPPATSRRFWLQLQRDLAPPPDQAAWRLYTWPARRQFILTFDEVGPLEAAEKMLPWLQIPWDEAGELLRLKVTETWREIAIRDLITSAPSAITCSAFSTILASQSQTVLLVDTLGKLLVTAKGQQSVRAMFVALQECPEESRVRLFLNIFQDPVASASVSLRRIAASLAETLAMKLPACETLLLQRFAQPDFRCSVGDYAMLVYYLNIVSSQDLQRRSAYALIEHALSRNYALPEQLRLTLLAMKKSYALLQAGFTERDEGIRARLASLKGLRYTMSAIGCARRSRSPLNRNERAVIINSLPHIPGHLREEARLGLIRRLGRVRYRALKYLERDVETLQRGKQGAFGELVEAILASRDNHSRRSMRQVAPYIFLILRRAEEPKWTSLAPGLLALALRDVDESSYWWLDEQVNEAIHRKRLAPKALPLWLRTRSADVETGEIPIHVHALDTGSPRSGLPIDAIDTVVPPGASSRKNNAPTKGSALIQHPVGGGTEESASQLPTIPKAQAQEQTGSNGVRRWWAGFLQRVLRGRDE